MFCNFNNIVIVKIKPGDGISRAGFLRLFFNTHHLEVIVKLDYPVSLRISYEVPEDQSACGQTGTSLDDGGKAGPEEYVVAKNEAYRIAADKRLADDKRLRQAVWAWLDLIADGKSEMGTITEQSLKETDRLESPSGVRSEGGGDRKP